MEKKSDKSAILGLSMGHFVADLYSSAIIPLYPLLTQKLGITLSTISLIVSIGHLTSSMLQPLFGYFSDKMKKRAFMINGLILGAIFIPLTVVAPNPILLCLFLLKFLCYQKSCKLFWGRRSNGLAFMAFEKCHKPNEFATTQGQPFLMEHNLKR